MGLSARRIHREQKKRETSVCKGRDLDEGLLGEMIFGMRAPELRGCVFADQLGGCGEEGSSISNIRKVGLALAAAPHGYIHLREGDLLSRAKDHWIFETTGSSSCTYISRTGNKKENPQQPTLKILETKALKDSNPKVPSPRRNSDTPQHLPCQPCAQ